MEEKLDETGSKLQYTSHKPLRCHLQEIGVSSFSALAKKLQHPNVNFYSEECMNKAKGIFSICSDLCFSVVSCWTVGLVIPVEVK
jgi:hypothetical protein